MKRIAVLLLLMLSASSFLVAGRTHDVALSFGMMSDSTFDQEDFNVRYGSTIGLTKRTEVMVWGESEMTPRLCDENKAGIGLTFAMSNRSTGSRVQGPSCNTLVTVGLIASEDNDDGNFLPTSVYLSITPFSLGTPIMGKRERMFELGVAYNWCKQSFSCFLSLVNFDYYIHGTWKDYYR